MSALNLVIMAGYLDRVSVISADNTIIVKPYQSRTSQSKASLVEGLVTTRESEVSYEKFEKCVPFYYYVYRYPMHICIQELS